MADTQLIKDRIDIVQLISEYIQLKKSGINWKANCPFHQEKTPSFMVHPEKQIWHCFGCGKGGDIFSFVQEMEGMDFPEALKLLADRAGVKIDTFRSEVNKSQKNRIIEVNNKAAHFFHHFLLEMAAAKPARDYLQNRGLKPITIEEWQIGYIPEQWDLLTKYLLKKGLSIDDILLSGLAIKKEGADVASGRGVYDRFRGRVMFPIWDVHNNVVGFTGRILVEKENSGGKYINTPQTMVYDKSRVLYGLNKAKTEIKNQDKAVLVEGQMDVVACHQAGMKNVAAVSGTALTLEQVRLLKRYSNNLAMAFDDDAAGENAAKRGIDVAIQQGMNVKVIQIPEDAGKDADECIKNNPQTWFKAVEQAQDVMEWYFAKALTSTDLNDPKQKQLASDQLLLEINKLPYAVEKEHWLKTLSEKLGVEVALLKTEMKRLAAAGPRKFPKDKKEASDETAAPKRSRLEVLAENLLALFLKFPASIGAHLANLNPDHLATSLYHSLYESLLKQYNDSDFQIEAFRANLDQDQRQQTDLVLLKAEKDYSDFGTAEAEKEMRVIIKTISQEWKKQKRDELTVQLKQAQTSGNQAEVTTILQQLVDLTN